MTAVVMHQPDGSSIRRQPRRSRSSLPAHRLVTVRYAEPRAFQIFFNRAQKKDAPCVSGVAVLVGPAGGHHRSRSRSGGAHPGRGRQAVTNRVRRPRAVSGRGLRFDVNIRTIGREGELPRGRAKRC